MTTKMKREIVSILCTSKPNYEDLAFEYFILSLNKIQSNYEFVFPDIEKFLYPDKSYEVDKLFETFEKKILQNMDWETKPDYIINIITSKIEDNFFWV